MMNRYIPIGSIVGLAMAASLATSASAQNYNDPENGNEPNSITLICWGEGRKPSTGVSTGYAWNQDRHKFVPQTYVHNTTREFDSEVQVELQDDRGRIHLTGKLVPPIHSGGSNGWWDLDNVRVGSDMITARYRLNGLNKPRVEINRRTGRIKIDGIEKFRGECDQGTWGQRRNRF